MKDKSLVKKTLLIFVCFVVVTCVASNVLGKSKKARFYDFSDQLINGEIKKPTAIYMESRTRAKFAKLLRLKKSFRRALILSYNDPLLK
tara:strand:+ start:302 stop:568 length:267 start_codon:yes stop_codon:yes gene_type:complete